MFWWVSRLRTPVKPVLRTEQHSLRDQQTNFMIQPDNLIHDIDDNVTEATFKDAVEQLSKDPEGAVRDVLVEIEQAN
ncbi:uncharacterized protein B0H64DRAFT_51957 [Chaetomium fimeti]|jgi:flagellar hook-basal body complex protein FliE|uniref:Uncharacterized protein n=1 Tax=Chaetomium fimeti TaxID=1854472 RepID=A0AAE0H5Z2_9PEZI|nr:hypothetical protein B0H64DRAFT_51957 [Chaetomium fimeti]